MTQSTYVIAEIGVNHNGSLQKALELIHTAARLGANAAKFQHFSPDSLVTKDAPTAAYQRENDNASNQSAMLSGLALSDAELEAVKHHCDEQGIDFLCTPFDLRSASFVAGLRPKAIKIGSGDLTFDRLLRHVSSLGLPVILSTGMADMTEIQHAVSILDAAFERSAKASDVFPKLTLLQCTSNYPTRIEEVNLGAMVSIGEQFGLPVGLSDHTADVETAGFAVACGAQIIEKHITLDRNDTGPDHAASLEPEQFSRMMEIIRKAELARGDGVKHANPEEIEVAKVARRSLFVSKDIKRGQPLTDADIIALRPGTGIPPTREADVIGRTVCKDLDALTMLKLEHFDS